MTEDYRVRFYSAADDGAIGLNVGKDEQSSNCSAKYNSGYGVYEWFNMRHAGLCARCDDMSTSRL